MFEKCICRLDNSRNNIIMLLTNPRLTEVRYQFSMWKYWHSCLFLCVLFWFVLSVFLLMDLESGNKVERKAIK